MSKRASNIKKGQRVGDTIWGGNHIGTVVGLGHEYGLPMVHVKWDRRPEYKKSWPYDLIPKEFVRLLPQPK